MISALGRATRIYKIPMLLHEQGLDDDRLPTSCGILARAGRPRRVAQASSHALEHPEDEVDIAMVGKYVDLQRLLQVAERGADATPASHNNVAGQHPLHRLRGARERRALGARWPTMDAILVPGGFGKRGIEGKIARDPLRARERHAVPRHLPRHAARDHRVRARNVAGLAGANSTEFDPDTPHPVVALITEWHDRDGRIEKRAEKSDLGGTMRLGAQTLPGRARHAWRPRSTATRRSPSATATATRSTTTTVPQLEAHGLQVLGASRRRENLTEIIELPGPSVVRRRAVPPGVHVHAARTAIRCSRPFIKAALRQPRRARQDSAVERGP